MKFITLTQEDGQVVRVNADQIKSLRPIELVSRGENIRCSIVFVGDDHPIAYREDVDSILATVEATGIPVGYSIVPSGLVHEIVVAAQDLSVATYGSIDGAIRRCSDAARALHENEQKGLPQ